MMLAKLKALNDKAALALAAAYGSALCIWMFAGFSIIGAFVPDMVLAKMLYWSNAAQLVFCPLSVYVSALVLRRQQAMKAKHDETHALVKEMHTHVKTNHPGGV
ncbi:MULTISPECIES: hypothetical protein [Arthrobacter]|uniref:Uncharacterized protein n=1 Tax=Arthrobacter terricola TaxID=2547396 RepID=A0A4R5KQ29_9MICC|nr:MULTISPECIES: hypothetical protein [Arthrobacter]MBT8160974.1 hypothetical protein [Arthrobacter sp. GN70]TDF96837.1 hypothetical protein E1809_08935 [Arthrobacter terricola]